MVKYLLDNNAISHFFSGLLSDIGMDFMSEVLDQTPNISVITQIEALSWITEDKQKEDIVKAFIDDCVVHPLSSEIVLHCVKLRRGRKINTPDAIIAATAIVDNLTLITSDKDFSNISGLKIINPKRL